MPKIPKPICKYKIPLYGGEVWLYLDRETYDLALYAFGLDESGSEYASGMVCTVGDENGNLVYAMGVFDGLTLTLSHESFHVVLMVTENAGFSVHDSKGEPGAYLMGDMFSELAKGMVKYHKTLDTSKESK